MQRQAVPFDSRAKRRSSVPGMERVQPPAISGRGSCSCKRDGHRGTRSTPKRHHRACPKATTPAVLSRESLVPDIYTLTKFKRSNQNTCINPEAPLARVGRTAVKKAQVLADGPCHGPRGNSGLGRNVLLAFVPLAAGKTTSKTLSSSAKKLVKDDYYTSIHIEEYENRRRGRHGSSAPRKSRATSPTSASPFPSQPRRKAVSIPHRRGREAGPTILVGKVTPKGETTLTRKRKTPPRDLRRKKPATCATLLSTARRAIEGTHRGTSSTSTRKGRGKRTSATKAIRGRAGPSKLETEPCGRKSRIPPTSGLKRLGGSAGRQEFSRPTCTTKKDQTSACGPRASETHART